MDANKLKVLRAIDYVVGKACCWCVHGAFGTPDFGQCTIHHYEHGKHSSPRMLSIHRGGCCRDFLADAGRVQAHLAPSGFDDLVDRRAFGRNTRHKAKTSY